METNCLLISTGNNFKSPQGTVDNVPKWLGKPDMSYIKEIKLPFLEALRYPNCTMYSLRRSEHLPINEKATKLFRMGLDDPVQRVQGDVVVFGLNPQSVDQLCDEFIRKDTWFKIRAFHKRFKPL